MVDVRVEQGDVLTHETDVLVLKYAQALYGADRAAVEKVGGLDRAALPPVGKALTLRRPRGLTAAGLVLLGVVELSAFGYEDIRRFGMSAVSVAAREFPAAREITLTLHGAGFGLDESEAFQAEVGGVLEAYGSGRAGPRLRRVVIVEQDPERVRRLEGLLPHPAPGRGADDVDGRRFRAAGVDSARKRRAFIAMPFADEWGDHFYFGIQPPLRAAGMVCERMDQLFYTGDVLDMMKSRIDHADLVVADISTANPNVYLEIGYAWASGKTTILLCHNDHEPHFDVRGQRHLRYGSIRELANKLEAELTGLGLA